MTRWSRRLALLTLSLTLAAGVAPRPVHAQEEAPAEEGKSEGRPLDGYLGTAVFVGLALFIVGKSARR